MIWLHFEINNESQYDLTHEMCYQDVIEGVFFQVGFEDVLRI